MSVAIIGAARQAYNDELHQLEHDLLEMASLAAAMVEDAAKALSRLDAELALNVIKRDDEVDIRDIAIEERCVRLLALQQPMAGDLRTIGTAMKMITDIERIGDLAVDIAKITLKIEKEYGEVGFIDLPRMADCALAMVREALQAYVHRDLERVKAVCERDEEVDDQYRALRGQIFQNMRERPDLVVSDGWLLLAIHHVERIADHAVNIAERVHFMVTGDFKQLTGE
ncbi:phosphate signaling complex protein PhoU [Fimbriimonas ginsengisoli]|uniref:Phosphate-specific transport system accessory protein PhoU n=1 Tax=Fimbriimonas ginsengisoli Gsoil 348 TaxID=661478 RepID=A0A068NWB5_FIMGI|nr:phosphate signaling complex protein PhoU [Fimbriimonas ginsengisoli]AIE87746.1 Phosphate transport system regulatory protein PhoU [Fimbriimonas ginsengisoli Gsoil 348]